ncbi:MAG: hypothetical protein WC675_01055 [Patescibacteria group bacterium]|jgi:hypothetical protein
MEQEPKISPDELEKSEKDLAEEEFTQAQQRVRELEKELAAKIQEINPALPKEEQEPVFEKISQLKGELELARKEAIAALEAWLSKIKEGFKSR